MTIPTYKEIIPVLLQYAATVNEFHIRDSQEFIAKHFGLSDEEVQKTYATQKHTIFYDRIGWAKSALYRSGLLSMISRGVFKISEKGVELLNNDIYSIHSYIEEHYKASSKSYSRGSIQNSVEKDSTLSDATPDEMMQEGYKQIKENLKNDLLEKIKEMSPMFFEGLVVKLLKNMGYGDPVKGEWEVTKGSNDEGIDGIIKEDALGLEVIYIQAKRWSGGVGRPEIQKFAGALLGKSAKKGVFITTSDYSSGAIEYARNIDAKIILINGSDLAEYMVDYNVGVSPVSKFEIKALDTDFFEE